MRKMSRVLEGRMLRCPRAKQEIAGEAEADRICAA
jgi:hypothetical protein